MREEHAQRAGKSMHNSTASLPSPLTMPHSGFTGVAAKEPRNWQRCTQYSTCGARHHAGVLGISLPVTARPVAGQCSSQL